MSADKICTEIADLMCIADDNSKSAAAILDAARVLCALERAPEHQDSHPGHNIKTGGGFAHGARLYADTLPTLLSHAFDLVHRSRDDYGIAVEQALAALKGGAA